MTLGQLRAWADGHQVVQDARERAQINIIRLAVGGSTDDLERRFSVRPSADESAANEAATLAAFGAVEVESG